MQSLIHLVDKQTGMILDYITEKNYWKDNRQINLNNNRDTFDFTTFSDKAFSEHIQDQNRIVIPDPKTGYAEFIIEEHNQKLNRNGSHHIRVYSSASYLRLKKAEPIDPQETTAETAFYHVNSTLAGTGFYPGEIAHTTLRSFSIEEHTNPYSFLKRIASEFDLELQFRIAIENEQIVRYVDMLERIGRWRGFEVSFGHNLLGIERKSKSSKIVTALLGVSPADIDGNVKTVLVEDNEALKRWGTRDSEGNLQHLYDIYRPQSSEQDMTQDRLETLTENELKKRVNASIEYSTDIATLSHKLGQQAYAGDPVRVKDLKFNPPLYLEARVHTSEGSIKQNARTNIVLGDYVEFTEEEVMAVWRSLQKQVSSKIEATEMYNYAEPKKIESDTQPDIQETNNPIWIDTSQTIDIPHVVIGNEWRKMTPTEANEVDAYSQIETDNIVRDASRLETGIVDVNNVPLRTAPNGARLEFDGVNGLVQYDTNDSAVSWLDLDGNAHFENGYFSGEVHAQSGTFSGDIESSTFTAQDGEDGYVRINDEGWYVVDGNGDIRIGVNTTSQPWSQPAPSTIWFFEPDGQYTSESYIGLQTNDSAPFTMYSDNEIVITAHKISLGSTNSIDLNSELEARGGIHAGDGQNIRTSGTSYIETNAIDHNGVGSYMYLRPQPGAALRATEKGTTSNFVPFEASSFNERSIAEGKTCITKYEGNALDVLRKGDIHEYYLKNELANGQYKKKYGFVIGDGYQVPDEVLSYDRGFIASYSHRSMNTKAIQELEALHHDHADEINWLKLENQYLKARVQKLEEVS